MIVAFLLATPTLQPLPTKAQDNNNITIEADGSITPSSAPIQQEGQNYTLTDNFQGSILIQKSSIVFNGAGYWFVSVKGSQYCLKLQEVSNVTITNVAIRGSSYGYQYGIFLQDSKDCQITNNTIIEIESFYALNGISFVGIYVSGGSSNAFTKNLLTNNLLGMLFIDSVNNLITDNSINYTSYSVKSSTIGITFSGNASENAIYHNNFWTDTSGRLANSPSSTNIWDDGSFNGGNYWNGYTGNGTYIIDENNVDHYPLTEPVSISSTTAEPNFSQLHIIIAVAIALVVIALVFLLFRRHRKSAKLGK